MKLGVQWSVKGIRPEARETAKRGGAPCRHAALDWLNSVIINTAAEQGVDDDDELFADSSGEELGAVNAKLDALSHRLERLQPRAGSLRAAASATRRGGTASLRPASLCAAGLCARPPAYALRQRHRCRRLPEPWQARTRHCGRRNCSAPPRAQWRAAAAAPAPMRAAGHAALPPHRTAAGLRRSRRRSCARTGAGAGPLRPRRATPPDHRPHRHAALARRRGRDQRAARRACRHHRRAQRRHAAPGDRRDRAADPEPEPRASPKAARLAAMATRSPISSSGLAESATRCAISLRRKISRAFTKRSSCSARRSIMSSRRKTRSTLDQLENAINTLRQVSSHIASNETVSRLASDVQMLAEKIDRFAHVSGGDALERPGSAHRGAVRRARATQPERRRGAAEARGSGRLAVRQDREAAELARR